MSALQIGPGLGVVEVGGIQGHDIGLPALMFGVTDGTVVGLVAVEALSGGDAGADLGMTGEALGRRDLARRLVAFGAFVAGLRGVRFAQGAGDLLGSADPGDDRDRGQDQEKTQAGERGERVSWPHNSH
jgi:hypothetical protein